MAQGDLDRATFADDGELRRFEVLLTKLLR
jgi:hypothetical protein